MFCFLLCSTTDALLLQKASSVFTFSVLVHLAAADTMVDSAQPFTLARNPFASERQAYFTQSAENTMRHSERLKGTKT